MREVIVDLLYAYKKDGSYLNIALNHVFNHHDFSLKDKELITTIVYGTVQNELYLEAQLKPYIKGRIKLYERVVLLMSLYQMIFLDKVPSYAVINEAVRIVKKKHGVAMSKVVNAILREFDRQGVREIECDDLEEKLSIETSMPLWIVKMISKQYDEDIAKRYCLSSLKKPRLTARVNTLKSDVDAILQDEAFIRGNISPEAVFYKAGNIAHHPFYKEGKITIQDESSQLVASFLSPKKDSYVLDMCCAPGSKTTHLAAIMENTGHIDAFDLYEHKIKLVQNNLERLGVKNTNVRAYDAINLEEIYEKETFDYILLDAPCSGLGVVTRKPEIKYQDSSQMDGIIVLQKKLLRVAYRLLKPGGILVYSTCTINKKENQFQIKWLVGEYPNIKLEKEQLILPDDYESDGFYMCRMKKESL